MGRASRANNKRRPWVGIPVALVIATAAAHAQAAGSNSPNPGFYHGGWCGRNAGNLRTQYGAAMRSYDDAKAYYDAAAKARAAALARGDSQAAESDTHAMDDAQTEMDRIREIIRGLRREWNNIKGQCSLGDIGDDPDASAPSGTNSGGGSGGGGGGGGGGGSGSGGASSSGAGGSGGSGGSGRNNTTDLLMYEVVWAPPPNDSANRGGRKGLGVLLGRQFAARRELQLALASLEKPAVAHDSLGVVRSSEPRAEPAQQKDISPVAQKGLDGVAYVDREIADLLAYRVDYGRYLGARAVHDRDGAQEQATAMQHLIDDATDAAHEAAARFQDVDLALHTSLAPAHASAKQTHPRFVVAVNPELERELRSADLNASDYAELTHELKALSTPEIATGLRRVTARMAADSLVRQRLDEARSLGKWPNPSELPELDGARATAMAAESELEAEADSAAPAQTGTASGGPSSHPIAPVFAIAGAAALVVLVGAAAYWLRTPRRRS